MRRFAVGLMLLMALVAVSTPASAQGPNGTADPLGLISSAVIQPYWSEGPNFTLIELLSPVWFNFPLHGNWFNATCTKIISFPRPMTRNDLELFAPEDYLVEQNGLLLLAWSFDNGETFRPIPDESSIHSLGHWVNFANDHIRVVRPIAVASSETCISVEGNPCVAHQSYSPLRTAASWTNPQLPVNAPGNTIFLICPSSSVYGLFPTALGFPAAPPVATSVYLRVFNNERYVFDRIVPCTCISGFSLSSPDVVPLYQTAPETHDDSAQPLWYTEATSSGAFTGFRLLTIINTPFGTWPGGGSGDQFSALNNASANAYLNPKFFFPGYGR